MANTVQNSERSSIIFLKDTLILFQEFFKAEVMFHESMVLLIGYENPFSIKLPDREWEKHHAVVIDSDIPYEVETGDGLDAVMFIIPETAKAIKLKSTVLDEKSAHSFSVESFEHLTTRLRGYNSQTCTYEGINHLMDELIDAICDTQFDAHPVHEKVVSAVRMISKNMNHDLSVNQVARKLGMTEGRLNFMFRSQVGISVAKFIQWTSMACVLIDTIKGEPIEKAVNRGGFYHLTDFSHVFTKVCGIPPKHILTKEDYHNAVIWFEDKLG